MTAVRSEPTEHERLKGLWCRGVATIEQIERCKVLDSRKWRGLQFRMLCKIVPAFCAVFCLIGGLGGFSVGVVMFDLDGAALWDFVRMHMLSFAKYSIFPASVIVIAALW